jgi:type IV secretory pathway VirJ component
MSARRLIRLVLSTLIGIAAAVLVASCGSSGHGLIPEANAGPLQSDFEAVAQAAQEGNGNCTATTAAINKTEQDFASLPATVDSALRNRLSEGISNLRERALALCAQPLAQTNTTTNTSHTTTTPAPVRTQTTSPPAPTPTTTSTPSSTPPTATTPASPTTPPANNGGGTAAPKPGESGASGGTGVEEAEGNGLSGGGGAGNQEGGAK